MKLSIAMIVKNEEKYIENTLKPLKKLQEYIESEIVIVDTGSTDNTVEIAKKYTNKIYFHKWNNNFGDMRNISINYCSGDWILVVDADEVLYDVKELAKLIKNKKSNKYNAGIIKIINFNRDVENSINNGAISPLIRIFKRGTINYLGSIHEQPQFKYPLINTNIRFIHYGYDNRDCKLMEYKFKRNLSLLMKETKKDPDNIYIIYQISASYSMHKDSKEALKYIEMAYAKCKKEIGKYIYVLDKYCSLLYGLKEYRLLLEKVEEGLQCENFIDFYFYKGEACYNLGKYEEAIEGYNEYLNCYEKLKNNSMIYNATLSITKRGLKNNVLYNLALSYYNNNSYDKALNIIFKIEDKNILKEKVRIILKIIVQGKVWNKVSSLDELIDKYNYENILFYIHKEVLLEDLIKLSENLSEGNLKEIVSIVKYFKENDGLDKELIQKVKKITNENKIPYAIYIYYILKYDINEIENLIVYGKNKIENILIYLCANYYDFNSIMLKGLEKFKSMELATISIRTIMEKVLLLSGNLPKEDNEEIFLNYVANKYYCIIKTYNSNLIENNIWMLTDEDRFILQLKKALQYKYEDTMSYIKSIKDIINLEKSYTKYIEILTENLEEPVNKDIKALIPSLIESIKGLLNKEKYQEAYDTVEEALSLVKFDFDLMMLKFNLLIKFNYKEEAIECLKEIILYGEARRVNKVIEEYF
ncbi:glycosyltransferase family 2 protein [Clostridium sp. MSJ-11]|uniref:Glycosyltransferase family 2 protein n=1 Tax=Clostridium mobile TaxID=2841512 RepID=A0ABS6EE58_9CLOT|nr:glycosyltransferase family 2 protein [Clostridium mobile]MBU5483067.1 glycosyltransferase family 2 protein [Clostridium mobile]